MIAHLAEIGTAIGTLTRPIPLTGGHVPPPIVMIILLAVKKEVLATVSVQPR